MLRKWYLDKYQAKYNDSFNALKEMGAALPDDDQNISQKPQESNNHLLQQLSFLNSQQRDNQNNNVDCDWSDTDGLTYSEHEEDEPEEDEPEEDEPEEDEHEEDETVSKQPMYIEGTNIPDHLYFKKKQPKI